MSNLPDKTNALLAEPSLEGLAYLLRHKELWPKGFRWSFPRANCCAIGLAYKYWWPEGQDYEKTHRMLNSVPFDDTFVRACPSGETTPERFAKRIDRHLARQSR